MSYQKNHLLGLCVAAMIACVYGLSFFLPVHTDIDGTDAYYMAGAIADPCFFANPVFWIGMALLVAGCSRAAGVAGVAALALGLGGFRFLELRDFLIGYYCWLASMAMLAVVGLAGPRFFGYKQPLAATLLEPKFRRPAGKQEPEP